MEAFMAHILDADIKAFEQQRSDLMKHHNGKFVVFHRGSLAGVYDSFDTAAKTAVTTLEPPYLIRQVGGAESMPLPASVAFRPVYAAA
jgi:hypothetical protein